MTKKILTTARKYEGLREIPGHLHEEKIVQMFKNVGHPRIQDDETAWCAAFLGSVLLEAHPKDMVLPPLQNRLAARSYEDWGVEVSLEDAQPGDILTFWRKSPTSWQGHTGILVKKVINENKEITGFYVLGGNQKNRVGIDFYPIKKLTSIRRWPHSQQESWITRIITFITSIFQRGVTS